jgi:hypothetical protein
MQIDQSKLPPPPGLIASLASGFDSVANHILVILPPVLLDLFLWFGPHLRLQKFLQPFIDSLPSLAGTFPSNGLDIPTLQKMWIDFASQFNLFMLLRTFPVGSSSLFSLQALNQNPFGIPVNINAGSFFEILGWSLLLALLGWLIGALYYFWISAIIIKPDAPSLWKSIQQSILLSAVWVALLFFFGIPASMLLSLLTLISPFLGQVMLFIGALVLIWMIMPVFFSAHGIFALQLNAVQSLLNSLRMVRFTLPNTSLFLLVFVIITEGLNFLWNTPPQDSLWMLVGVVGHAFVSTALLAASFVYYRDINVWLKAVLEQLQQQQTTSVKV